MPGCIRSTPVVLVPGMMCTADLWSRQVEALAPYHAVTVGDITRADNMVDIALQLLAEAPPSFALAGLSMGGIVAMEMWRRAPERIERLALLDTNFRSDLPDRRSIRDRQVAEVNRGGLESVLRDELKPGYLAACHQANTGMLDKVLAMGMSLGPAVFTRQSIALRDRSDYRHTLATIACPTLVLCGEEDRLCPPQLHAEMAELIPSAELQVIPDCGHLPTIEQPQKVNSALLNWLGTHKE